MQRMNSVAIVSAVAVALVWASVSPVAVSAVVDFGSTPVLFGGEVRHYDVATFAAGFNSSYYIIATGSAASPQPIPANTVTVVQFPDVAINAGIGAPQPTPANTRFFAPVSGIYHACVSLQYAVTNTGTSSMWFATSVSATNLWTQSMTGNAHWSTCGDVYLKQGVSLNVAMYAITAATLTERRISVRLVTLA